MRCSDLDALRIHVPLLLLGVAVLPLAMPVGVKIVLIWLGATAISLAANHWLIRPWPPIRWLMGMAAWPAPAMPVLQANLPHG
jgi:hypothetical protein